jgi:hypothetical protein
MPEQAQNSPVGPVASAETIGAVGPHSFGVRFQIRLQIGHGSNVVMDGPVHRLLVILTRQLLPIDVFKAFKVQHLLNMRFQPRSVFFFYFLIDVMIDFVNDHISSSIPCTYILFFTKSLNRQIPKKDLPLLKKDITNVLESQIR